MSRREPLKTIIGIKLRGTQATRQLFQLGAIFLALFATIAGVAGIQVFFCKQEHPRRTVLQCAAPLWSDW